MTMNKKKILLPFTKNNLKGGNKKSYNLLNEKELSLKTKETSAGMLNFIKKMLSINKTSNNFNNKVNYVKATKTEKYYKNLK